MNLGGDLDNAVSLADVRARLLIELGVESVIDDESERYAYSCDGLTGWRAVPGLVVLPRTTQEVALVVKACYEAGIPYVARGSGTGLSGGALPSVDGVLVVTTRMNAIVEIDPINQIAVVEPGVINASITAAVSEYGLYYAPDPSSQIVCSIGGNVAENSGGAHCLKYGFTTNHVVGVEVVLPDGTICTLGGDVAETPGFDLRGVFIGSEGTLGIATKVFIRLLRKPERVKTLVADFATVEDAGNAVSSIVAAGIVPAAVEMMDLLAIEACEQATGAGYTVGAVAALIVELDGPEAETEELFEKVVQACEANHTTKIRLAQSEAERLLIWRGRKAAFAAAGRLSPAYLVQDGVIPRTALSRVLHKMSELADAAHLRVANVFHAGDGNLHPLVLYNPELPGDPERATDLANEIIALCVAEGGSITGEHGVGVDKVCSMTKMFSDSDLACMHRVRRSFDRSGISNPGKLFPTPRLCGEKGGKYEPHSSELSGLAERW